GEHHAHHHRVDHRRRRPQAAERGALGGGGPGRLGLDPDHPRRGRDRRPGRVVVHGRGMGRLTARPRRARLLRSPGPRGVTWQDLIDDYSGMPRRGLPGLTDPQPYSPGFSGRTARAGRTRRRIAGPAGTDAVQEAHARRRTRVTTIAARRGLETAADAVADPAEQSAAGAAGLAGRTAGDFG